MVINLVEIVIVIAIIMLVNCSIYVCEDIVSLTQTNRLMASGENLYTYK